MAYIKQLKELLAGLDGTKYLSKPIGIGNLEVQNRKGKLALIHTVFTKKGENKSAWQPIVIQSESECLQLMEELANPKVIQLLKDIDKVNGTVAAGKITKFDMG